MVSGIMNSMNQDPEEKKMLIDKPIFHSRINNENITGKEKWLGYFIGSAGALLINAMLAQGVRFLRRRQTVRGNPLFRTQQPAERK